MIFIDQLAGMYDQIAGPRGIPWDGLIAKGHGITENGYDPAYMDIMLQDGAKFFGVVGGLSQEFRDTYRTIEAKDARHAMTQLMALVNQTGADIWDATKRGEWDAAVNFPRSLAVDALATLAATAANGAYLHYDGVMEQAMLAGKITPEEVMAHADSVVRAFRTFVDLGRDGHLDQFKTQPATAGLRGPELPAAAIYALAALGIVLVLGLCYLFYVWQIGSPITNKVIEYCDKLVKTGTPDDQRTCVQALQSMDAKGNSNLLNFMGGMLSPLVTVAAVGLAVYIGSLVLPGILARRRASA
jgi:hypothetical protein